MKGLFHHEKSNNAIWSLCMGCHGDVFLDFDSRAEQGVVLRDPDGSEVSPLLCATCEEDAKAIIEGGLPLDWAVFKKASDTDLVQFIEHGGNRRQHFISFYRSLLDAQKNGGAS